MNFQAKHVEALRQFGYVEREAEFLYIVAVHSGFFARRQFIQYAGVAGRQSTNYWFCGDSGVDRY
jgi:hypothetical protein